MPVVIRRPGGNQLPRFHVNENNTGTDLQIYGILADTLPEPGKNILVTLHREDHSWKHCHLTVTSREPSREAEPQLYDHMVFIGKGNLDPDSDTFLELPICCRHCRGGNDPLERQCVHCGCLLP